MVSDTHPIFDMHPIRHIFPDTVPVRSELEFSGEWDALAVSELIRAKSAGFETPAFLFLGRKEANLLREHFSASFGEEAVVTLQGTYYMGLRVTELGVESFLALGGRKSQITMQDPIARRPPWRDRETDSLWQLRLRP